MASLNDGRNGEHTAGAENRERGSLKGKDMRDDFKQYIRQVLAHSAGFRCSKPDCRAATAGPSDVPDRHGSIGIAAHITAASPGGPRYDPTLSPEERGAALNGIWLCDIHAREVDGDTARYTADRLRSWKRSAEDEARAMLGRPLSAMPVDVKMGVSLQRDVNDGLLIVGTTNLPDGTRLMGTFHRAGSLEYGAQAKCSVHDRQLLMGPFTDSGRPLPQHWYQFEIVSYFNGPWRQPKSVLDIIGADGAKLAGRLAQPLDPDLEDTGYSVRAGFECPAPPLTTDRPLSAAEVRESMALLHRSKLEPDGHLSSKTVGEVVQLFMGTAGLSELEGWMARMSAPGVVSVTYSYRDGDNPTVARWDVMPRIKEVRYRNRAAKALSWAPG